MTIDLSGPESADSTPLQAEFEATRTETNDLKSLKHGATASWMTPIRYR